MLFLCDGNFHLEDNPLIKTLLLSLLRNGKENVGAEVFYGSALQFTRDIFRLQSSKKKKEEKNCIVSFLNEFWQQSLILFSRLRPKRAISAIRTPNATFSLTGKWLLTRLHTFTIIRSHQLRCEANRFIYV